MSADLTSLIGSAIDFFFVDDRRAPSMGLLFSGVVVFFAKLFGPVLQHQSIVDFAAVPLYLYPVVGVFSFNAPRFFRVDSLPRTAETRLKVVRAELRAKRLTPDEAQALYKKVLEEELANLLAERQVSQPRPRKPRGPRAKPATV